jgi:hypothetical protein
VTPAQPLSASRFCVLAFVPRTRNRSAQTAQHGASVPTYLLCIVVRWQCLVTASRLASVKGCKSLPAHGAASAGTMWSCEVLQIQTLFTWANKSSAVQYTSRGLRKLPLSSKAKKEFPPMKKMRSTTTSHHWVTTPTGRDSQRTHSQFWPWNNMVPSSWNLCIGLLANMYSICVCHKLPWPF